MSRTAQTADITIVDNVIRGMKILIDVCKTLSKEDLEKKSKFDNKKNLRKSILTIRKNLRKIANA